MRNDDVKVILGLVVSLFLVVTSCTFQYWTYDTTTVTVERKERITTSDSSYYLVFTDKEVFINRDSFWYWKWNSSDVYGGLKKGMTYELAVYGWRIPFFSMYRNVVSYTACDPGPPNPGQTVLEVK